jgi:hypothetical protein
MLAEIVFQPAHVLGLFVGLAFGLSLFASGLANPDKIIGTLRLKDFHAMRVIAVFLIVGMLGVWAIDMATAPGAPGPYNVKTAQLLVNALGGALLGIGFGLTGYCPGTGLACAAAGRFDALITVIGMMLGALLYIWIYPYVVPQLQAIGDYGKVRLPEITGTDPTWWVLPISAAGLVVLYLTRPRRRGPAAGAGTCPAPGTDPLETPIHSHRQPEPRNQAGDPLALADEDKSQPDRRDERPDEPPRTDRDFQA